MKKCLFFWSWILGLTFRAVGAGAMHAQTLELAKGWNAIWLEVTPIHPSDPASLVPPADVFSDVRVTKVASFFPARGPVEFFSDPGQGFNRDDWKVWSREDPAGQSNLGGILGNRAYLIEASGPVSLVITGEVRFHRIRWQPDSYNLVGFGVVAGSEPTFARFFEDSKSHAPLNAFQIREGQWTAVSPSERIHSGQAYWVYCSGPSDYQGPLSVMLPGADGLDYGSSVQDLELVLGNESSSREISCRLERLTEPNGFELVTVLSPDPVTFARREGTAVVAMDLRPVVAGGTQVVTVRSKRQWQEGSLARTNLYKAISDVGTYFWIPAKAVRNELLSAATDRTPESRSRGLWVGEVQIDKVARLDSPTPSTEMEPTSDALPLRVIVHVDAGGRARLLKHVTVMRRKRVSDRLDPGLVLVTDERLIPSLEGIQRRGGKLVGQRLETDGYDLPRRSSLATPPVPPIQPPDDFDPSVLEEDYVNSLEMDGGIAWGRTLQTRPGTLVLDPWHRTNPFRHAFHPQHRQGQRLVREISLRFDPGPGSPDTAVTEADTDVFTGIYVESIEGLAKPGVKVWMSGRFQIRRISEVAQLDSN